MKRRDLIKSLAMPIIVGGSCVVSSNAAAAGATSGELAVGQSLRIDKGLKLTFTAVRNDSRCPMGAMCIWEGDATVVLEARLPEQPVQTIKLHTNKNPRSVVIPANPPGTVGFKTYQVRLVSLAPRPRIGTTLKQSDYRLKLAVDIAY